MPDLVLLDLMLAKVDGLTICKTSNRIPKQPYSGGDVDRQGGEWTRSWGWNWGRTITCQALFGEGIAGSGPGRVKAFQQGARRGAHPKIQGSHLEPNQARSGFEKPKTGSDGQGIRTFGLFLDPRRPGPFPRRSFEQRLGYDYFGTTRTVDVHVRRLREKLAAYEKQFQTVKGYGYLFKEDA